METKDIRLKNLLELSKQTRFVVDFCRMIGMKPSYFSQIKTRKKAIGDATARKVERILGLPTGFMDVMHESEKETTPETTTESPTSDVMGVAYSIASLPEALREQFKRLVYQMADYCSSTTLKYGDVKPFHIEDINSDGNTNLSASNGNGH
jgi:hypothetical protein